MSLQLCYNSIGAVLLSIELSVVVDLWKVLVRGVTLNNSRAQEEKMESEAEDGQAGKEGSYLL